MPELGDEEALPRLLAALGDDATYRLIRLLLQGPQTTKDLIDNDVPGLNQSGVSNRLLDLQRMGLVDMAGRAGRHKIRHPSEIYCVLRAALALAEEIEDQRASALKRVRRALAREQMDIVQRPAAQDD